jgi:hypothetical protein
MNFKISCLRTFKQLGSRDWDPGEPPHPLPPDSLIMWVSYVLGRLMWVKIMHVAGCASGFGGWGGALRGNTRYSVDFKFVSNQKYGK